MLGSSSPINKIFSLVVQQERKITATGMIEPPLDTEMFSVKTYQSIGFGRCFLFNPNQHGGNGRGSRNRGRGPNNTEEAKYSLKNSILILIGPITELTHTILSTIFLVYKTRKNQCQWVHFQWCHGKSASNPVKDYYVKFWFYTISIKVFSIGFKSPTYIVAISSHLSNFAHTIVFHIHSTSSVGIHCD